MKASEELPRLKAANLPRADWRCVLKEKEPVPADDLELQHELALMDDYFRQFVEPVRKADPTNFLMGGNLCVCCGTVLGGFFGSFVWGIAHGEGYCRECGYPGRAKHYKIGPIVHYDGVFQYHPDGLEGREEKPS